MAIDPTDAGTTIDSTTMPVDASEATTPDDARVDAEDAADAKPEAAKPWTQCDRLDGSLDCDGGTLTQNGPAYYCCR